MSLDSRVWHAAVNSLRRAEAILSEVSYGSQASDDKVLEATRMIENVRKFVSVYINVDRDIKDLERWFDRQ